GCSACLLTIISTGMQCWYVRTWEEKTQPVLVNYRECSGWVKGIGGNKAPVPLLGYGDVTVVFLTEGGRVPVLILNAAHVPESPHNLLSLSALAEEGHTYSGQKGGLTLTTRAGGKVW
ncbi:unnamed protein product, partial [Ectocarpus sp. 12 AP-2014]